MSVQLIQQYYNKVERVRRYSGATNESALRQPFLELLGAYASSKDLLLVTEVELRTRGGRRVIPDGTLKDALRQDWGYWESKDEKDDLNAEIAAKFAKGYPATNILFEDTHTAVLYQNGDEVARVEFAEAPALDDLLTRFVSYEPQEVTEFHRAIEQFNVDVPALAEVLRSVIQEQQAANAGFREALSGFLELSKKAINPSIDIADVREMLIQHVLTEDIFMTVFDEPQFHRENAIARKLQEVVNTFYHGATRRNIHGRIAPYYETINARAAQIYNHHEKQKFLKALYENFYKAYNPKAADRLGIVYTPDEIVRFMIHAADHLVFKHFGKTLGDSGVEILDPTTGTGTFVTELIEYLPEVQLPHKYQNEIHCNEVSILPYYIANLNIEYTYKQKMGAYVPFENICFVDTLDNLGFEKGYVYQAGLFSLTDENIERIQRQNERKISVIIGNPPYNAWQENFNFQNPNRPYKEIDKRIKDTYIKYGTAQNQIAVYDMYTRFYRWATDRLGEKGIIAFVTNRSLIDARTFDGFRKVVADEFSNIYLVDLGGSVRENPKLSGPKHNVFAIQTGVVIAFMIRRQAGDTTPCKIHYSRRPEMELATDKLQFLASTTFSQIEFEVISPDKNHIWINQTDNDFDTLMPLVSKAVKARTGDEALFRLFSVGVKTQRDEWVYDISREALATKMQFFVKSYQKALKDPSYLERAQIKWDNDLASYRERGIKKTYEEDHIVPSMYRPFIKQWLYFDEHFNGRTYQLPNIFPAGTHNMAICCTDAGSAKPFMVLITEAVPDLHLVGAGASTQCLALYRYSASSLSERAGVLGQGERWAGV